MVKEEEAEESKGGWMILNLLVGKPGQGKPIIERFEKAGRGLYVKYHSVH